MICGLHVPSFNSLGVNGKETRKHRKSNNFIPF